MHAEAYARARKLLGDRQGTMATVGVLGVVQSLLVLAMLAVVGLLAALLTTQGEARVRKEREPDLLRRAPWVRGQELGLSHGRDEVVFESTGVLPVATSNLDSRNPLHRAAASGLLMVLNRMATLRNNAGALANLLAEALGLLALICLIAAYRRRRIADAVTDVATALRGQIHRQMYRLGQSSLPTEGTGPVVNLLTRETNDVRDGLYADLDRRYRAPVLAVGLALFALIVSPVLTLALASLGALVWLVARVMLGDARLVADAATRDAAVQLSLLHEDLGMIRTVRVFGMENVDKTRFEEHLERFRDADARRLRTEGTMVPTLWLLFGAATALAMGLLGYSVLTRQVAAAAVPVVLLGLAGTTRPALEWLGMRKAVRQANRSAAGVFEFLDRKPELHQQGGALFLAPVKQGIRFENVTLESRSGKVLLDGVSAEIAAGSRTAIMSLDDDSKHALVCLVPRLIDPQSGRVRIDGMDLREVTLESVRAQVATVLQADLVFTDSVLMNIGLGDTSYSMPRVIEAAKTAHAHHFIQDLPHGYDTVIGPVGHYLRPDELYRIALARAFLHDPTIMIVEEPLAPLDEDVKPMIDDALSRIARNRTLILLPHRLSTIRSCSQIIILHNGRLETAGSPRQLQHESKLYRHLQYVEFNQFATGEIEAGQMSA